MNSAKPHTADRIVAAAVQLFSVHGIKGTTTQEIARVADLNQATLFRYFPRKIDMFWAAVRSQLASLPIHTELLKGLDGQHHPEIVLPQLIEFLVRVARDQPALLRLLCFTVLELPADGAVICRKELGPLFYSFNGYLERCVETGIMRPLIPRIAVVGLATTVLADCILVPVLTGNPFQFKLDRAIAAYSDFWLAALVVQDPSARRPQPEARREEGCA